MSCAVSRAPCVATGFQTHSPSAACAQCGGCSRAAKGSRRSAPAWTRVRTCRSRARGPSRHFCVRCRSGAPIPEGVPPRDGRGRRSGACRSGAPCRQPADHPAAMRVPEVQVEAHRAADTAFGALSPLPARAERRSCSQSTSAARTPARNAACGRRWCRRCRWPAASPSGRGHAMQRECSSEGTGTGRMQVPGRCTESASLRREPGSAGFPHHTIRPPARVLHAGCGPLRPSAPARCGLPASRGSSGRSPG